MWTVIIAPDIAAKIKNGPDDSFDIHIQIKLAAEHKIPIIKKPYFFIPSYLQSSKPTPYN